MNALPKNKSALIQNAFWAIAILSCSGLFFSAPASAARPAAVLKVVSGTVQVQRNGQQSNGQQIAAVVGTELYPADVVLTGSDGRVGMTYDDNSLLSLGPSSRFVLERFEFNRTTHEGVFNSTLTNGKLAVVSGKIAKQGLDAMQVRTPSSILGVRGTVFVVEAHGESQ